MCKGGGGGGGFLALGVQQRLRGVVFWMGGGFMRRRRRRWGFPNHQRGGGGGNVALPSLRPFAFLPPLKAGEREKKNHSWCERDRKAAIRPPLPPSLLILADSESTWASVSVYVSCLHPLLLPHPPISVYLLGGGGVGCRRYPPPQPVHTHPLKNKNKLAFIR